MERNYRVRLTDAQRDELLLSISKSLDNIETHLGGITQNKSREISTYSDGCQGWFE